MLLKPYAVDVLWSDQYSGDALRDIAADVGLSLIPVATTQASKNDMFKNAQTLIRTDQVDLPPDPQVKQDLLGIRRRFQRCPGELVVRRGFAVWIRGYHRWGAVAGDGRRTLAEEVQARAQRESAARPYLRKGSLVLT